MHNPKSRPKQPKAPSAPGKPCSKCRFVSRDGDSAFCRRYPPSLRVDNGASYVPVKPEWTCGEWSKS